MSVLSKGSPFPFSLLCALFGTLAFAGFYSELLKRYIPAWLAVGILILPISVLVFVHRGEVSDRFLVRSHISAALLFLILAVGIEIGPFFGYQPEGMTLYRVMAHLAWTFAWAGVIKDALKRRPRE